MTWVKICGITNPEDALTAVNAGADALGFVFYEPSPRYVEPQVVRQIGVRLPERVERVGVFVGHQSDRMLAIAAKAGLTAVQLLGEEDPVLAPQFADGRHPRGKNLLPKGWPNVKVLVALSMRDPAAALAQAKEWDAKRVRAFLLDSGSPAKPGGTGQVFDWNASLAAVEQIRNLGNIVAAGGLTPENVGRAVDILKPWGVDVSSGVEASPGKKDPEKVRSFIRAAKEVQVG
jgi:phosphoribosylanthranilate isomerase